MRETVTLDLEPSELRFECKQWSFDGDRRGVLVSIGGEYRPGSAGATDAAVMNLRISEACELVEAAALVVDLRSLDYQWGDDIDVDPRGPSIRALSVVRPDQMETFAPMLGREWVRTDLDSALDEVERQARAFASSTKRYLWSEVWRKDNGLWLLRAAADGSFDLFDPATARTRSVPRRSLATEGEARAELERLGYLRVEGRS